MFVKLGGLGNHEVSGGLNLNGHSQQLVLPEIIQYSTLLTIAMRLNKISKILHFGFSSKRFHQILGVSINATSQQVKAAYYRMAKAHHPDHNPSQSGTKFNQIRNAYQELLKNTSTHHRQDKPKQSNSTPKQQYKEKPKNNQHTRKKSHAWQQQYQQFVHEDHGADEEFWDFQQKQLKQFQKAFNSFLRYGYLKNKYMKFKPYFDEIFMKGTSNFSKQQYASEFRSQKNNGSRKMHNNYYDEQQEYQNLNVKSKHRMRKLDIAQSVDVSQDRIGSRIKVKFQRQLNCHKCQFNPEQNVVKQACKSCKKGDINATGKCSVCKGRGFSKKYDCKLCKNKGFIKKTVQETIQIPLGIEDGWKIVIQGHGHQHKKKGNYGDLILTINILDCYKKKGENKKQKQQNSGDHWIQISMLEAVLGCITTVKSGKGSNQIRIPAGVQYGDSIKNSPRSQPNKFKINFVVPSKISKQEKAIFQKLRELNLRTQRGN